MATSRRQFLKKAGASISALTLGSLAGLSSCLKTKRDPNIVLIFTDDQGYHDLGCYGAKKFETPNVDKLAEEGMRFSQFYASQAVCSASRASLLTGCYAERVSIQGALMPWSSIGLNPEEETIAEILKRKNYRTGIFGKWHLGHQKKFLPPNHGFDKYLGLPYSNDMWPVDYDGTPLQKDDWRAQYPPLPLIKNTTPVDTIETLEDQSTLTTRYTEAAVEFIEKNRDNPFFLYLPHSMPHVPLGVSDKFRGKSEQGMYGDVIMEIDWSVGQIMKTLKKFGLEENTLVIFASDNGPWLNYGNHAGSAKPLREGKGTMFEGGPRVPCVMKWDGVIPEGKVCHKIVASIDILPTIAEITGTGLPKKTIDGISILPLLKGHTEVTPRNEFYYYYEGGLRAVRRGKWKLQFPHRTRSYQDVEPGQDGYPGPYNFINVDKALYNLEEDIDESNDLSQKYPDKVKELEKLGEIARQKFGDQITGAVGSEIRQPGRPGLENNKRIQHLAKNKKITLEYDFYPKYTGGGENGLLNGIKGTKNFNDGAWQGFEYKDLEATIDLEKVYQLEKISAGFLINQGSWIFAPKRVQYFVSQDGHSFQKVYQKQIQTQQNNKREILNLTAQLNNKKAQYIKIIAENIKTLPDWHKGSGGRAWIFCDEIVVK